MAIKIQYRRIILIGFMLCCCASFVFPFFIVNNSNKTISSTPNVASVPSNTNSVNTATCNTPVNLYRRSEPAPMGITDYGVNPKTNDSYTYNTTAFLGTAKIYSLSATDGTFLPGVSVQLNVLLKFTEGSSVNVYWLQNIADIYTTSKILGFWDNIWNMSSETINPEGIYGNLNPSAIRGSGTCNTYIVGNVSMIYYKTEATSHYTQTYPSTFQMEIKSSLTKNGDPIITFEYKNGNGNWIAYDNVTFITQSGSVNDMNLVVDGSQYTPDGHYYDAELVVGGKFNGQTAIDQSKTKLDLQLEYNNGSNFQPVPHAYNFGSDTAESISNVIVTPYNYTNGANFYVELTNGPGSLGPIVFSISPLDIWLIVGIIGAVVIGAVIFFLTYFSLKHKKRVKLGT